MSYTSD